MVKPKIEDFVDGSREGRYRSLFEISKTMLALFLRFLQPLSRKGYESPERLVDQPYSLAASGEVDRWLMRQEGGEL
jgi:hypothetical protein